jgi:hypothetical protein
MMMMRMKTVRPMVLRMIDIVAEDEGDEDDDCGR